MNIGTLTCTCCGQAMSFDPGMVAPAYNPAHWYCNNGQCAEFKNMVLVFDCQTIPHPNALRGQQDAA